MWHYRVSYYSTGHCPPTYHSITERGAARRVMICAAFIRKLRTGVFNAQTEKKTICREYLWAFPCEFKMTHTHMKIRSRQRESKYSTNGYYLALGAAKELYVYSLAFPLEYIQRCWAWMVDQSCAIAKWQVSRMIRWLFSSQYSVP